MNGSAAAVDAPPRLPRHGRAKVVEVSDGFRLLTTDKGERLELVDDTGYDSDDRCTFTDQHGWMVTVAPPPNEQNRRVSFLRVFFRPVLHRSEHDATGSDGAVRHKRTSVRQTLTMAAFADQRVAGQCPASMTDTDNEIAALLKKPILTVTEAAKIARANRTSVYRWINTGQLPASKSKSRGKVLIQRNDLLEFLGMEVPA